jgi:hypothetical protein
MFSPNYSSNSTLSLHKIGAEGEVCVQYLLRACVFQQLLSNMLWLLCHVCLVLQIDGQHYYHFATPIFFCLATILLII